MTKEFYELNLVNGEYPCKAGPYLVLPSVLEPEHKAFIKLD